MSGEFSTFTQSFSPPVLSSGFLIRSFQPGDCPDVHRLYHEGSLARSVDYVEHASDLDDIVGFYFQRPENHLWIAVANRAVIGMVSIWVDSAGVAHLRRLRIAPDWQRENDIAVGLLKTAIAHARSFGCVKLVFHTALEEEKAVNLLNQLGLKFYRSRHVGGRHLVEFLDDLYAITEVRKHDANLPRHI